MSGYLTPSVNPTGMTCRVLVIPDDEEWLSLVRGALETLTEANNFFPYGTLTPQQTAAGFVPMFDGFCFNAGVCRMIGELIAYAGTTSPNSNWLVCNGSSLLRADYPDLFAVIGTAYGAVDGSHFNLPDLQGRSPMGAGAGVGLTARTVGDSIGEENHTLTTSETPSHTHTDSGHTHSDGIATPAVGAAITGVPVPSAVPGLSVTGSGNANLDSVGGGSAHNTIHPALVITYLIVALP